MRNFSASVGNGRPNLENQTKGTIAMEDNQTTENVVETVKTGKEETIEKLQRAIHFSGFPLPVSRLAVTFRAVYRAGLPQKVLESEAMETYKKYVEASDKIDAMAYFKANPDADPMNWEASFTSWRETVGKYAAQLLEIVQNTTPEDWALIVSTKFTPEATQADGTKIGLTDMFGEILSFVVSQPAAPMLDVLNAWLQSKGWTCENATRVARWILRTFASMYPVPVKERKADAKETTKETTEESTIDASALTPGDIHDENPAEIEDEEDDD